MTARSRWLLLLALVFNNTSTTMNDTVVDFAFSHYRGDMSNFEFETSPN